MLRAFEYWLLCNLGALAIVLIGVNIWLYGGNRMAQAEVNARAQYIQQTAPISDLYQQMARTLAELAMKNHDDQIRAMLSGEGFTISAPPAVPAKPAPALAPRGKP